ncbi:uncharacterized protein B0H18DRAFT_1038531 [Fomitopsis serialis]|uniref:uncharacterized protein n=1 Tax=Fomitopsis serialis TaxID=139415 RepID=UPI002007E0E1|nr:uncharacterized protein B0H18DRAFT_1038531 [Neoantrodia serialis]KAH9916310.1 hypothetical protein B0H18DRAFT_1038531 [Neoantrodia serialis]
MHWRKIFPPTKRKTRLDYMWEYIRSRGRIWSLGCRVAELEGETERLNKFVSDLQRQLASRQQNVHSRSAALPTPGPSTPAAQAVDAYPTPWSEADVEESPLLLVSSLLPAPSHVAPLTPESNPRPFIKRRAIGGAPATPSPLARQVPIYALADADVSMDESDADNSMAIDQLNGLEGAEDSMMLDDAADLDDEKYDELSEVDVDEEFQPLDECAAASSSKPRSGKDVFMRITDAFGNFVGDIFTSGRARSVGPSSTVPGSLEDILPTPYRGTPTQTNVAACGPPEPFTKDASITATPSYCSRALSPISTGPDSRDAEIDELKTEVIQLKADLELARGAVTQKDACIEELQRQLDHKQRRLRLLMSLHVQMDQEFEKEKAGQ